MKKYTKIYMQHFGYGTDDFIPCEICGARAVDIHHIEAKGMGGTSEEEANKIENLMALCRADHIKYGDKKQHMDMLYEVHAKKLFG